MRLRYSFLFFSVIALLTVSLIIWLHLTEAKGLPMRYLNTISSFALWSARSIFSGPFPKWKERLSEAYIVLVTGFQASLLGLVLDCGVYWRRRHHKPISGG
jgi:hypothetical protein